MKPAVRILLLLAIALLSSLLVQAQPRGSAYHIIDSVALGGEGGWDYLTLDTAAARVYVSRGNRVQVVNLENHTVMGEIQNTTGVHGIALAPSVGRGYTSNGRDSSVTVFDMKSLKTLMFIRIDARNPDAIIYDSFSDRVFTFNGGSASATAIDVQTNKPVGTVPLSGKPEFAVSDGKGRIYVNIEDRSEITAFDPKSLNVLHTWSIAPGEEPSGLAIDREKHLLFSGCGNKLMVIFDARAGKVASTVPIGEGVDGTAFDPGTGLAFASNGEGTLTVVREELAGKFVVVANVPTRRGARTLTLDPLTHRIYTVTAKFSPPPPPSADRPHPRPLIEPGTQTLYILGE